jgi:hypothetical protein
MSADLTVPERANCFAASVVSCATAYLNGSVSAAELAMHAGAFQIVLMTAYAGVSDIDVNGVLDPVRLLVVSMIRTATCVSTARQDRWSHVMGALIDLVCVETHHLRLSGAQRS